MTQQTSIILVARDEERIGELRQAILDPQNGLIPVAAVGPSLADIHRVLHSFQCELLVCDYALNLPASDRTEIEALGLPVLWLTAQQALRKQVLDYLQPLPQPPTTAPQPPTPQRRVPAPVPASRIRTPAQRKKIRIGFYGVRGGVGTTTAAITAARLLADSGISVALFDAPRRGDPFLLQERLAEDQPLNIRDVVVYPELPATPEVFQAYQAVVVDGGRHKRAVNVKWYEVSKPLSKEQIQTWLGL